MYPGNLPLIFNGSVPGHEKLFNVRRCSMYTGVQFDRFHCISEARRALNSRSGLGITQCGLSIATCNITYWSFSILKATFGCELLLLFYKCIVLLDEFKEYAGKRIQRFYSNINYLITYWSSVL